MKKITCLVLIIILISCGCSKKENLEKKAEVPVNKQNIEEIKLTMVGDFLYETPYYKALEAGEDKKRYFSLVKNYFLEDDLSLGNMEVVIGDDAMPIKGGDDYVFSAPPFIGKEIVNLGMDVMTTANNHAFDQGSKGIISTIDFFKENSEVLTVGTFKNKQDRDNLNIKEIKGVKFGFLAYTLGTNIKPTSEEKFMIATFKDNKEEIAKEVKRLRSQVDVLIVMMHWGVEFTYQVNETQKEIAQFLNELGVDIIVGSHSHCIQPIEWIKKNHDTLVYYSLGNFVSADDDISRTNEEFDNAYQVGLLSQLVVQKSKDKIEIKEVKTEPIVNYYDKNMRNFLLVPFKDYTSDLETSHLRYKYNFNRDFIDKMYKNVIAKEFR